MARQVALPAWEKEVPEAWPAVCGWCKTGVRLGRRGVPIQIWHRPPGTYSTPSGGTWTYTTHNAIVAATYVCPLEGCGWPTLIFFELTEVAGRGSHDYRAEVLKTLPRGTARPMEGLPPEVERDRLEAWSCFYGGDVRAAALMGRASLQRAVRALGATGKDLKAELQDLLDKQVITSSLHDAATEIRIVGNDAAHPEQLGVVKPNEAEESLSFLDDFLRVTFSMPSQVSKRKGQRPKR